jgi:hypothetical protein
MKLSMGLTSSQNTLQPEPAEHRATPPQEWVIGPRRPGPINNTASTNTSINTSGAPTVAKGRPMIIPPASEVGAD